MSALSVHASDYTVIYVQGDDAKSYLQGQLTQDLNDIPQGQWRWAGHCSAKGKLWACLRVCHLEQGYALLCSSTEANVALGELKKYAVFSKVEISQATLPVVGILSSDEEVTAHFNIDLANSVNAVDGGLILRLAPNRFVYIGEQFNDSDVQQTQAVLAQQIKAGEPSLNSAAIDEFVPQMVNLQALGGISFKKGCYTGQETVARMKYLGKNKRAMFIVKATHEHLLGANEEQPEFTLDLERQVGENWRRAGTLISQACHNGELVGLAVLPNDTELDVQLRAKHAPEVLFNIEPLPYSLTEE